MPHPTDNGLVLQAVDEIRDYEQAKSAETITNLTNAYEKLEAEHTATETELTREKLWRDAHMKEVAPAGHPTTGEEPTPEPPAVSPVFGTSYGGADESRNKGRSKVARIFFTGDCPADPFSAATYKQAYADGNRAFVFSWKGTQTGAQIKAIFAGKIPKGTTIYGCYWHEPEDNIPSTMTLEAWTKRHVEHQKALREAGVTPVGIFMAWSLNPKSGRDITDYHCGDDGFMFDAYFNPAKGKDDPVATIDKCVAAAKAAGAKFGGLGETGVPDPVDDAVTISLTKKLRAKLDATPYMRVNCYWPSRDFVFINDAHADAWFTDPTPAPLVASREG